MTPPNFLWVARCLLLSALLVITGCKLPFPGPHAGRVIDASTGEPIQTAEVEAEWWCHDNPLPDGPGSFFLRSSTFTDEHGAFRIDKEDRRGGLFGSGFVLKVSKDGYIPLRLIAMEAGEELPESTVNYPLVDVVPYRTFRNDLQIELKPALPVLLETMRSGEPLHQKVAREELTRLLGVDLKYDADAWETFVRSGSTGEMTTGLDNEADQGPVCPCPNAADRSGQPREVRKKVREFVTAARNGKMEEVKRHLETGMDPNARNYACRTALMGAAGNGHAELLAFLLNAGADVNARDDNCRTALMKASARYDSTPLVQILISHGADPNARDKDGTTPLMQAAAFGNRDTVEVLLSHGANVNVTDKDGESARFKAAVLGRSEIVALLESHGAKTN